MMMNKIKRLTDYYCGWIIRGKVWTLLVSTNQFLSQRNFGYNLQSNVDSVFVYECSMFVNPVFLSGCSFPVMWFGEYFQVEYANPLRTLWVTNRTITEKGECVWNSGSQYVLRVGSLVFKSEAFLWLGSVRLSVGND